ncbi:MAG TPA: glycosyltransferase family 4 protein [Rhizomicrobium sp.]|jgi:glycosyltransferase involved in cell wall biosynthesis|nr:glycosyltransferase family 4 protein [Rhizomicrobium sp.]
MNQRTRDRLRILTFTTLYPNAVQPNHGVFVENRLQHLVQTARADVHVVAPVPWFPWRAGLFGRYAALARTPAHEVRRGVPIEHPRHVVIPRVGMSITPTALFLATLPLIRQLNAANDFNLIDAHYFYPDGVAATLLGAAIRRPVVITARGTDISLIPRYSIPRHQILYAAKRAAGIVAVSEALKSAMVELGMRSEKITVLRNGVDLTTFVPGDREVARASLQLTGKTLLSVGHLIERKGHGLIIAALPRLKDCGLIIVGRGAERAHLEALGRKLGVSERVRFAGEIAHKDLRRFYVAADALVLASSREGWPNVLLEAMACGTPVVATAIWGNPEVVSKPEAGVLAHLRTPDGIADAVESLFQQLPDRAATRAYAEQFSWDDTSSGQLKLFEEIARRGRDSEPVERT